MIVFGCIILSFTLSSLKRKSNWNGGGVSPLQGLGGSAWLGLVSGSVNLGHLASTTVDSRSGIIQPDIQYRRKKNPNEVQQQAKIQHQQSLTSLHNATTSDTVDTEVANETNEEELIENHLKPLSAAYKSVTGTTSTTDLHLNNEQSIWPPGFINTWIKNLQFCILTPGHCLMSHFWILAFSTNFCTIEIDLSGNTVWPPASGFQKLA